MNKISLLAFIITTTLMLLIPFKKNILNILNKKPGIKNITIYGYTLIGLAILNIAGLTWNYKVTNKPDPTYSLKKSFDDTLYSLSKQLNTFNLVYDKTTNIVKRLYIESSSLEEDSQWVTNSSGNSSNFLAGLLRLFNRSQYPIINIKGKMFLINYKGSQITNSTKSANLFTSLNLMNGQSITPGVNFICSIAEENIFYTKIEYEDEDGFSRSPIRHIYSIRNASGETIQPTIISNEDSIQLIKEYLIKNDIW